MSMEYFPDSVLSLYTLTHLTTSITPWDIGPTTISIFHISKLSK